MSSIPQHSWNLTVHEAEEVQRALAASVISEDRLAPVRVVAGVDVGYEADGSVARAAVAALAFPSLELVEHVIARRPVTFPYIPGLLSFREAPVALEALEKLSVRPDLLLCDGQGFAHPRRFGFACHVGLLADIPTVGVAKRRLVGRHAVVPDERGAWQPLLVREEVIGAVLCTRAGVKPVFVSIGHRISLLTAIDYVLRCTPRYRLPEPIRWAHRLASAKSKE